MLLGAQEPRLLHAPSVRANAWEDVSDLAKAYGLVLDEWQENVLAAGMGERSDGKWAASTVGVNVPRQNGKGGLIEARELAGVLLFGEKTIIHSAHEQKTARVGFERIKAYFDNYDDLRKKVRSVMGAVGREHIKFRSGAELHFPARSKGAIRGFSIDCLILDEAQILGDPAWEAIKPTISARPNTQTWLLGTTPTPLDDSAVFTRTRDRALTGKSQRLCWCEWSASTGANLDDAAVWAAANPAFGLRITRETVQSEREELSDDGFSRERLGIWPEVAEASQVLATWADLVADPPADTAPAALSVDMSHDRALAIAGCWDGDKPHVELLVQGSEDSFAAADWLIEAAGRRVPVVIDSLSPAASLIPVLKARRVKVIVTYAGDMAKACGGLYDAAASGRLLHSGQEQLDAAVLTAKKRKIGDAGGWGWDRKDPTVSISPLVAVTLAHYGWAVTKKTGPTSARVVVLSD